jgi:hypothetical protein
MNRREIARYLRRYNVSDGIFVSKLKWLLAAALFLGLPILVPLLFGARRNALANFKC